MLTAAGVVMIVAVVLIVLALVYYLVSTILAAAQDHRRASTRSSPASARSSRRPRRSTRSSTTINEQLDAGVDLLEGLLVKKAGLIDAVGLVEGLYPGAAAAGFRNFPESTTIDAPRIGEVYTKGTLTLARLGREAPIAAATRPARAARTSSGGSLAARRLYPEVRQTRPRRCRDRR